jgi:hypothetical protein
MITCLFFSLTQISIGLTKTKDALIYTTPLDDLDLFWTKDNIQQYTEKDILKIGLPYLRHRTTVPYILQRWQEAFQSLQSELKYVNFDKNPSGEFRIPVTARVTLIAWWECSDSNSSEASSTGSSTSSSTSSIS